MTVRTPDEPYCMWRRVSACLPGEIEVVRLAPCPATPSKSIRLSQTIIRHNAGTGIDARAATSVSFRVVALVFGGLSMTVDVWRPWVQGYVRDYTCCGLRHGRMAYFRAKVTASG